MAEGEEALVFYFTFRNIVQAMQDKEAGVTLVEYEGKSKSKMTKPCVRGEGGYQPEWWTQQEGHPGD